LQLNDLRSRQREVRLASACTSAVEWGADHVPEKRMGVFGLGLILMGFGLQSAQYWVVLLDVGIRS